MSELPPGPIGDRIRELIDTVNAGDPEKVRTFLENRCTAEFRDCAPMERHITVFGRLYEQSRGFDIHAVRRYEGAPETEVAVIVRNRLTEGWHEFTLKIEPQSPHRIARLALAPGCAPPDSRPDEALTDTEIVRELKTFVERLADADAFSGSVLLARDGRVLFKGAYGLASKRFDVPNRVDTKFNLGSMNKMFTGVAITQLVQRGKLSLDDRLGKYLSPDWLPREVVDKIRIRHLLTHTSGLGGYFNDSYWNASKARFRELDDYKPLISGSTLAFEPGTRWQYSNTGMFLLGVVIEKVTGRSYFAHVRDNVHAPAGMVNTDCYDMDRPVPNLAMGYSRERGSEGRPGWSNNLYKHVIRGGPAGGGFSTVEDLLRFDIALRSHKLLNPEYTELVWSAKPELNSPGYGFGFLVRGQPGERIVGHSGGFAGISANLDMFLDSGYTAVVMSNYDGAARPVSAKMRELIARRKR